MSGIGVPPPRGYMEDKNMKNEMKNDEAVSPVIATILMVAITVVLAGVLYVWANSLASDQPETGTRNVFNADDAQAVTSDGGGDALMKLTFSYAEDDLKWAFVDIKLEVGDNVYDCGFDAGDACQIGEQTDDGAWGANEHITLSEGTDNIVSESGADVNIYVKYRNAQVSGDTGVNVA